MMMRKSVIGFAVLFTLNLAFAQDFNKSYTLAPGGQIGIASFLGDIRVEGYSGNSVEIKAFKKGPDKDLVQIADMSFGNRIELAARYPQFHSGQSSVDFVVRVPNSAAFIFNRLSSFGGNVEVAHVKGSLWAESVRGNVEVRDVLGLVSASSISGNVKVEIDASTDKSRMRFTSISGNIDVSAPANFDAVIDMSSTSGPLKTDFPVDIQERRYGSGRWARGTLGSGKQVLQISSVTGRVSLTQR